MKVTVDKANVFRLILIHLVASCGKLKRVESWRWSVFLLLFFLLFNNYLVLAQGKLGLLYELASSIAAIFS